ncbi:MAG: hypothetical protein LBV06_07100 [Propionibacteriaceae bacterium]|jgi:hypothetical protein|nr:hypothetical protein [Propionibacteriaceae bacterium]
MTSREASECHICHNATTHDNASWCPGCTGIWQADLAFIATQWTELATAETKQTRFRRIGAKFLGMAAPLPYNPAARDCRDQATAVLTGWAQVLRAPALNDIRTLTRWLSNHAHTARLHPAARDIWHETRDLTQQLTHIIDRPQDREYLGDCDTPQCRNHHWAITCPPGAHTARCQHCGTTYDADTTRTQRRQWSDDQLVTQAQLVTAGYPKQTVSGWIKTGALATHGTLNGRPAYNLGDARALRETTAKHGRRHADHPDH